MRQAGGARIFGLALSAALLASDADAGVTGVSVYGVSTYAPTCVGAADIPNAVPNATGFKSGLLGAANTLWTAGLTRTAGQVVPLDFMDVSRVAGGLDSNSTAGFDRSGDAIAYYSGHGFDGPSPGNQPCTHSTNCQTPVAQTSMPGVCAAFPPGFLDHGVIVNWQPHCFYSWSHSMALGPPGCGAVSFSSRNATRPVALGEAIGLTWAGAGTDGGINLAVFDMSFPFYPGLEPGNADVFAGVMLLLGVDAFGHGDTAMVSDRGAFLAFDYALNGMNSVVSNGWYGAEYFEVLEKNGGGCEATSGLPGGGINHCGGYTSMSKGATQAQANTLRTAAWGFITQSSQKPTGAAFASVDRLCNYDCATYPPILP